MRNARPKPNVVITPTSGPPCSNASGIADEHSGAEGHDETERALSDGQQQRDDAAKHERRACENATRERLGHGAADAG